MSLRQEWRFLKVGKCCKLGAVDIKRDEVRGGSYVPFHFKLNARRRFTASVK